ncbi:MAG: spore germination protein, partial [Firmicutes bacterium]|nr:spore germination protein [Bacillota bacterium]
MSTAIHKKLEQNKVYLHEKLDLGEKNFDLIFKELLIGGKKAALLFVDGLNNNEISVFVLRSLLETTREQIATAPIEKLMKEVVPFAEVDPVDDLEEALRQVLAGPMLLLVDGEPQGLLIDTREYPVRDPHEPDIEKITRGSRDGFVETLVFNVALIRRRIRDPQLRCEIINVGRRSVSDIAIMYIKDIADPQIVGNIRSKIEQIDIDALPMAEKTVEEFITRSFWNPFPVVRYTERPDVAATHLVEGHVIIIVDTSPSVMIAPITVFHLLQHAEEFRQNPVIGTYIRWIRLLGILISFLLIPIWLLLAMEPHYLPEALKFIGPKEKTSIPLYL